jgi:hypothetical protein
MCTQIYSAGERIGAFISWTHILIENYQSYQVNTLMLSSEKQA